MKSRVTIEPTYGGWFLFIETVDDNGDEVVSRMFKFRRLIEALNAASAMRLHVDNIDELPIDQYTRAS